MCIICVEIQRMKLTKKESISAYREVIMTSANKTEEELQHIEEVRNDIYWALYQEELEKSKNETKV